MRLQVSPSPACEPDDAAEGSARALLVGAGRRAGRLRRDRPAGVASTVRCCRSVPSTARRWRQGMSRDERRGGARKQLIYQRKKTGLFGARLARMLSPQQCRSLSTRRNDQAPQADDSTGNSSQPLPFLAGRKSSAPREATALGMQGTGAARSLRLSLDAAPREQASPYACTCEREQGRKSGCDGRAPTVHFPPGDGRTTTLWLGLPTCSSGQPPLPSQAIHQREGSRPAGCKRGRLEGAARRAQPAADELDLSNWSATYGIPCSKENRSLPLSRARARQTTLRSARCCPADVVRARSPRSLVSRRANKRPAAVQSREGGHG